jgi:hypothetical protein
MQLGMLNHLQKWIFHFTKTHERLDKYNAMWLSVLSSHHLTPKNMSYEEVALRNGKELKEMTRYLVGVLTQSLRCQSPAQHHILNHPMECTRALSGFHLYVRYTSHDDATLNYMENSLHSSHPFKDVSLLVRAGKHMMAKPNALKTEPVTNRTVADDTNSSTSMPSKKRREMNVWWDYISHEIYVFNELDGNFNFPEIPFIFHWVKEIF